MDYIRGSTWNGTCFTHLVISSSRSDLRFIRNQEKTKKKKDSRKTHYKVSGQRRRYRLPLDVFTCQI